MSALSDLQKVATLQDMATLLGFSARGLSYVLYKMPDAAKYLKFEIDKSNGSKRTIMAPTAQLKLLQSRLADLLYECQDEIRQPNKLPLLAHGFVRNASIVTNARIHQRRRHVLNLDIANFFPAFNFGRVRGFFIKDRNFSLSDSAATLIAQIACFDNQLPQGSPCSPIISNLITHLLDVRLSRLAKTCGCSYSRYADDLTFSTNRKEFPPEISCPNASPDPLWTLSNELVGTINRAGFTVNDAKTRMQFKGSRQLVTGLTVNRLVNIRPEYYRAARSMCNSLFRTGEYFRKPPLVAKDYEPVKTKSLNELEGILGHIFYVKDEMDPRSALDKKKEPNAIRSLFRLFLFYKNFQSPGKPVIITEGKTDITYIRSAIKMSPTFHPKLAEVVNGRLELKFRFLNFTRRTHDIMQLGGGSGDIKHLILQYDALMKKFSVGKPSSPVIILIDNDDGAKDIFPVANLSLASKVSLLSTDLFYKIRPNLYLVKTPEMGPSGKSCIEDLFDPAVLATVLNGKSFDPAKTHDEPGKYGKQTFAEKVVRPNEKTIDFSRFAALLARIDAAIDDYK